MGYFDHAQIICKALVGLKPLSIDIEELFICGEHLLEYMLTSQMANVGLFSGYVVVQTRHMDVFCLLLSLGLLITEP